MTIRTVLHALLWLVAGSLSAQDIPVNTWRTHFSYRNVIDVALNNDLVAATETALFRLERDEIETITKENGLSDNAISTIEYIGTRLLIGYTNGNLDILEGSGIINYPVILNSEIQSSKAINRMLEYRSLAYILTDFGVVILDPESGFINDSYTALGENGNNLAILDGAFRNDSLFLATPEGIIAGDLAGSVNLKDFRNWKRFDINDGIPEGATRHIASFNDRLVTGIAGISLFEYSSGVWTATSMLNAQSYSYIGASDDNLYIIADSLIWKNSGSGFQQLKSSLVSAAHKVKGWSGNDYIASTSSGVVETGVNERAIFPSGPFSNDNFRAYFDSEDIIIVGGGFTTQAVALERNSGYAQFDGFSWMSSNPRDPVFSKPIPNVSDISSYARLGNKMVFGSYGDGLLMVDEEGTTELIDETSAGSLLDRVALSWGEGVFISGVAEAGDGVWVLNYGSSRPYKLLSSDGEWQEFTFPGIVSSYPLNLSTAPNGDVWVILDPLQGGGILVFSSDGSRFRTLSTQPAFGNLPSNRVNAIRFDKEGQAWVATDQGVVFYPFTRSVLTDNEVDGVAPIFESRILFNGENVTAIEIDGGDRKWMATESTLWLFDKNVDAILKQFDSENSPLTQLPITDIRLNGKNGELFICSESGLISYRSDATDAEPVHSDNVRIFPNPIKIRDFAGLVTVDGLAENAYVKITDISGRVVWQAQANGGTFSWDLRTLSGARPQTGIYLVLSSNFDGSDTIVGKLALIN